MHFPDIIYRNNNYMENLHATDNNENKNIIFMQQCYIPKHYIFYKISYNTLTTYFYNLDNDFHVMEMMFHK